VLITVNDEDMQVGAHTTVAELLGTLGLSDKGIAVAVDAAVVPRSRWDEALIEGATVEVVTAVQGG
jgi:sulfur carrier protein